MEQAEIKDCPFCGSKATARHFADAVIHEGKRTPNHYVECCGCWAGTVASPDESAAIAKWNTRTNDQAKDEEIARLREALDCAKWSFAQIAQMHSTDHGDIGERCMELGRKGYAHTADILKDKPRG